MQTNFKKPERSKGSPRLLATPNALTSEQVIRHYRSDLPDNTGRQASPSVFICYPDKEFSRSSYFLFITRTNPANPIAPITASGTIPALVVAGTSEPVHDVVGSDRSGVSASSGRVVVAVRIFVCAALIGGTTLTT